MAVSVLIVEDERIVAMDLENRLRNLGFTVVGSVSSGADARRIAGEQRPDVVLMDICIKGPDDGIKTATDIERDFGIPSVYVTAYSDPESIARVKASHAYGYLLKPFQAREMEIAIELALYKYSAESELRNNRQLLATSLNAIDHGVITVDSEDRILFMNSPAETLTGWDLDEARGIFLQDVLRFDTSKLPVSAGQNVQSGEHTLMHRSGSSIPVGIATHTLEVTGAARPAKVVVIHDISSRLEREAALIRAKEAAEAAALAKSDFLSRVSHELRTPLNSIMGMAQLLRNVSNEEERREHTEILMQSARVLNDLISNVLDYNSLDEGRKPVPLERCSLHEIVESVVDTFTDVAAGKKLRLVSVVDPALPTTVLCNERHLRRILTHLLSNACKFTRTGSIAVKAYLDDSIPVHDGTGESYVVLAVTDTGPGIPEESIEEIFGAFTQLEAPATRTVGGAGLGLSIVRHLVGAINGSVTIDSTPGVGTTVLLRIPVRTAVSESLLVDYRRRADQEGRERRPMVLGVTDSLLLQVIKPWCDACNTNVVDLSNDDLRNTDVTCIITDATEWSSEGVDRTPVITVGVPVDSWTTFLIASGRQMDEEKDRRGASRVLVVDDDNVTLLVNRKLLEQLGYEVVTAHNGTLALEAMANDTFSVACIDIEMPGMDGWSLAERIRRGEAGPSAQKMALIAVTGHSPQDIHRRVLDNGFDDVLGKPFTREELSAMMRRFAPENEKTTDTSDNGADVHGIIDALKDVLRKSDSARAQHLVDEVAVALSNSQQRETLFRMKLALRRDDCTRALKLIDELI